MAQVTGYCILCEEAQKKLARLIAENQKWEALNVELRQEIEILKMEL